MPSNQSSDGTVCLVSTNCSNCIGILYNIAAIPIVDVFQIWHLSNQSTCRIKRPGNLQVSGTSSDRCIIHTTDQTSKQLSAVRRFQTSAYMDIFHTCVCHRFVCQRSAAGVSIGSLLCNGYIFQLHVLYRTTWNRSKQSCRQPFDLISFSIKSPAKFRDQHVFSLHHAGIDIMLQCISPIRICLDSIYQCLHRNVFRGCLSFR